MEPMTTAECIHVFENSRLQSESFTPEAVTAAYVAGLEAMREKAERENPAPLTPAEIQQMRGRPVWCPEIEAYGIISIDRIGAWKDEPFLNGVWYRDKEETCGVDFSYNIEERELTLYPYKPPGERRRRRCHRRRSPPERVKVSATCSRWAAGKPSPP